MRIPTVNTLALKAIAPKIFVGSLSGCLRFPGRHVSCCCWLLSVAICCGAWRTTVQADDQPAKKKGVAAEAVRAVFRVFAPKIEVAPVLDIMAPPSAVAAAQEEEEADVVTAAAALEEELKKKPGGEKAAKQYESKIAAITRRELMFMHDVCELRRSQFDSVRVQADAATRLVALKAARVEIAMHNGWAGSQPKTPDVHGTIENALLNAAKEYVDQGQLKLYQEEIESRQAFRKEAEASVVLGYIDRELKLTSQQRDELLPPLVKAWTSSWTERLQLIEGNGIQFLPAIPKSEIRNHLEPLQKQVFDSAFKGSQSVFFGMQMHQFPEGNKDLPPLEEILEFAPEEAPN